MRTTRYVTPLREGGSLPAVIEADDDGMYVLKFRGAGQGAKALIAELIGGELARAAGLDVPEIVLAELDPELARTEPDPEIQDLIRASAGLNLALDFLPGSITFELLAQPPSAELASAIVWLDAFITNVDRTPRNTNMLCWHRRLWLIDHGAALFFHHDWNDVLARSRRPFVQIRDHVLIDLADRLPEADDRLSRAITPEVVAGIVDLIPDAWLAGDTPFASPAEHRAAYREYFCSRLQAPRAFVEEAVRAHAAHL
ncbi:HipA family kinase [Ideonella sp. BN130291]|uniref:HipA family kinase n=1 Tax=Ideonella sp. BN130291 TaxID=3112940 RepID=UPI002E2567AA|nr:HipA family kinase [Ideonella sp. BN130291]